MGGGTPAEDRFEIAFFKVKTKIPFQRGNEILEFGSILVCPKKLVELRNYPPRLVQCNDIKQEDVASEAMFVEISDDIYDIFQGRIWAGHNILNFDSPRIREAFVEIGQNPLEPKGIIESLVLLTQRFGMRAGDMEVTMMLKRRTYCPWF